MTSSLCWRFLLVSLGRQNGDHMHSVLQDPCESVGLYEGGSVFSKCERYITYTNLVTALLLPSNAVIPIMVEFKEV